MPMARRIIAGPTDAEASAMARRQFQLVSITSQQDSGVPTASTAQTEAGSSSHKNVLRTTS